MGMAVTNCAWCYRSGISRRVASARSLSLGSILCTRWTTLAIALAALLLMINGARWLLQESPRAANQLVAATCVVEMIKGEPVRGDTCQASDAGGL